MYRRFAQVEAEHWWFQGRRRVVTEMIRNLVDDRSGGRTVLDVGSGTGEMTDMLREFGDVVAVEPAADAVAYSRERHPHGVVVRHGHVPAVLGERERFDLVTAFDVVEHVEDDHDLLRTLRDATRPGGCLVLTVPAFDVLWSEHDVHAGHYRRYTRRRMLDALAAVPGLDVEHVTHFNSLLFPAALAARLVDRARQRLAPGRPGTTDPYLSVPPRRVNATLRRIFAAEARLLRRVRFPFGVSLAVVCRRTADDRQAAT